MHYNWHRYYDPSTGRYTQTDPIGFSAGDANLYRYVGGNPVRGIDPRGLEGDGFSLNEFIDNNRVLKVAVDVVIDQRVVDFSAAVGDEVSFGLSKRIRDMWDDEFNGGKRSVRECSNAYFFGTVTGLILGVVADPAAALKILKVAKYKKLYRAVNKDELVDIEKLGEFRNIEGMTETKYFATKAEDATEFGKKIEKITHDGPYTVVETSIPRSAITKNMKDSPSDISGKLQTIMVPEDKLPLLSKPKVLR